MTPRTWLLLAAALGAPLVAAWTCGRLARALDAALGPIGIAS